MGVEFRRLEDDDLSLLHRWLNEPGVVRWWEGDDVSWDAIVRDYASTSDEPAERWIASLEGRPVGWLQCYATLDYAREAEVEQWWALGVERTAAGIDYLVGDPRDRGRGLGSTMIRQFVIDVVFALHPSWTQVCAAPLATNVASCRALENAGFRYAGTFKGEHHTYRLMVVDRTTAAAVSPRLNRRPHARMVFNRLRARFSYLFH